MGILIDKMFSVRNPLVSLGVSDLMLTGIKVCPMGSSGVGVGCGISMARVGAVVGKGGGVLGLRGGSG